MTNDKPALAGITVSFCFPLRSNEGLNAATKDLVESLR